jgi:DNA repair exonuclease SbcCD ATPase subunit
MAKKEETKVEKVSTITWAEKVLAKLNLSDKGKIGLFGDKLNSEWSKQIRNKKREIEVLNTQMEDELIEANEKLVDMKEDYFDAFLNVNTSKIETSDARTAYVESFTQNLVYKKNAILAQEQEIKDIKSSYEEDIKELQEQIDLLEEFKKNI